MTIRSIFISLLLVLPALPASAQQFGLWPTRGAGALRLVRHDVQVNIHHPVAETVVIQEFKNPLPYNLEAYFYYPVPAGATVTGLALWVKGERREARMMERQKAREIYQGIVNQQRDPALVERLSGSRFRIRIFPVLPRSRQRVELRFVQPVQQDGPGKYRYSLKRPPGKRITTLRLGARVEAPYSLKEVSLEGYESLPAARQGQAYVLPRPTAGSTFAKDIHLRYSTHQRVPGPAAASATFNKQRIFVAELPLPRMGQRQRRLAVLVDSSRSMRPHLPAARTLVKELIGQLSTADRLALASFHLLPRQALRLNPVGNATPKEAEAALSGPGSDLGSAFVPALRQALAAGARQIILITDGGSVYHQEELEHLLRLLFDRPSITVSVITMSGARNEEPMADMATSSGGIYQQLDSATDLQALAARLATLPPRQSAALQNSQGTLHVLRRESGRMLVAGNVPLQEASAPLEVQIFGMARPVMLRLPSATDQVQGARGLWALATMDRLMQRIKLFGETSDLRQEIVRLSKSHNVLSEYTALLATETDADYLRATSGRKWQRKVHKIGDNLPSTNFHSTPEPHEYALMMVGMILLLLARKRGWLPGLGRD